MMEGMKNKEVKQFLFDKKNIRNCGECPYNEGFSKGPGANRLPCGQYRCWVALHTKER